ncbi:MAG: aminotransferase class I/II-fold pyridoxal phosphate-dependent enzyme [Pseudomonadota bacterium]
MDNIQKHDLNELTENYSHTMTSSHRDLLRKLNRYHSIQEETLVQDIALTEEVSPERVILENGADGAIHLTLKYCLKHKKKVYLPDLTYGGFADFAAQLGVETEIYRRGHIGDLKQIIDESQEQDNALILCHPDNPTGELSPFFNRDLADYKGLLIVDEAYIEFSPQQTFIKHASQPPSMVVIRTFSKAFAAAGLRLGYIILSSHLAPPFRELRLPYPVNAFAIELGRELWAMRGDVIQGAMSQKNECGRVMALLEEKGFGVTASQTHFFCITHSPFRSIQETYEQLTSEFIFPKIVNEPLPYLRLSVGTKKENSNLLKVLSSED